MTQEEKELLITDLCSRLPYGVMFDYNNNEPLKVEGIVRNIVYFKGYNYQTEGDECYANITECKPYLRLMSSMTEEERKEWYATFDSVYDLVPGGDPYNEDDYDDNWHEEPGIESFDWLNAHHFDFRGLIDKGLALEAPKNMY